jgi:hypothetical protein
MADPEGEVFSVQPAKSSVLFLREVNIILTRDAWYVRSELNVSLYEEAIAVVRSDLMLVYEQSREFASIAELRQIETVKFA